MSYVKPMILFGLHLSPVSATYLLCDSGRLLNIKPQFSHLKMRTIIVSGSTGCDKSDDHSDREINEACESREENFSLPEELRRILRKGDTRQGSLRVRRNWKLLCPPFVSFYGSLLSHNHCFLTLPIIHSGESAAKRNHSYWTTLMSNIVTNISHMLTHHDPNNNPVIRKLSPWEF